MLFSRKLYADEMVVTIIPSAVTNLRTFEQPFFRVLSTDAKEAKDVLETLHGEISGIDIEYLKINKFIPKKE